MSSIDPYLGDFADDLDDDAKDRLERAFVTIATRYPEGSDGDDYADEREAARTAAAQLAFGDATAAGLVAAWRSAVAAERAAMDALTGGLAWEAVERTEASIVAEHGLNRMTVRKALGK